MKMRSPEVVVITGASAGVGRATVREFARRGAKIGLIARGLKGLEGARRDAEELGGDAMVLPVDVADNSQVEAAAEEVENRFGPIDVWVNDAMVTVFSPFKKMSAEEFRRATAVTYLGTVYGTMAALKRMLPRDRGTVVQVGSALAYRSIPLQSAYCGAKHAVRGFTDSLRSELIHDRSNVHLTMVHLPAVNTPQFSWGRNRMPEHAQPVPPIFQPEVPARAIYWAAHHRRRELFVGMPAVKAIEGNKVIAPFLDKFLASKAYSGQQTSEPPKRDGTDNLWEPADGPDGEDFGAHGIFDDRSLSFSPELWVSQNREWLGLAGVGLAAFAVGIVLGQKAK